LTLRGKIHIYLCFFQIFLHPKYKALAELAKAKKTIFLCECLGVESLRREIHEGLKVVENWNSATPFIFIAKAARWLPTV